MTTTASRFLLAALLLLSGSAAFAADGVSPAQASALYKEHCAKCHGEAGRADTWRGYLFFAQEFTGEKWQAAHSDEDILTEINEGPRIMPAFESTLSLAERQALVQVIRGFAAPAR
ncbi:MAG: c-type cytochrome [Pseudomonadota bacterium]